MGRCFVIQPFDRGAYDKRYEDVIVPAITAADLEDYRVDRDPAARVLIESIEEGIRSSEACIAEITTDNPNVWYELGFAMANGKPLVMICNVKERTGPFPFDVRHRPIIDYAPESPRDFHALQLEITRRLKALLEVSAQAQTMASIESSETIAGLSPHELAALQIVMENQLSAHDSTSPSLVQEQMSKCWIFKAGRDPKPAVARESWLCGGSGRREYQRDVVVLQGHAPGSRLAHVQPAPSPT